MSDYKNISIHENTWLALRIMRDQYGYDSMHQFIQDAIVKREQASEDPRVPMLIRNYLEGKVKEAELEEDWVLADDAW